jgi:hypothetical protein
MTTTTITWIPVAERLPDDDSTALLALSDCYVTFGWFDNDNGPRWWECESGELAHGVTHWADLPAAPVEQTGDEPLSQRIDVQAPDAAAADQVMALADTWQEAEEHYDRYAGRHEPDAARAALRAAVEQVVAERDALKAQIAVQAVPVGWKLVPVEPTEAMLAAARDWSAKKYGRPVGDDGAGGCWAAMLAASPEVNP